MVGENKWLYFVEIHYYEFNRVIPLRIIKCTLNCEVRWYRVFSSLQDIVNVFFLKGWYDYEKRNGINFSQGRKYL